MSRTTILYKDIAPGAEEDAAVTASGGESFSNLAELPHGLSLPDPIITGELNAWGLDGSFVLRGSKQPAFWSSTLSGEDCEFEAPPAITITFDQQYSSLGISITFDQTGGDYCTEVNIKWYQGSTLKAYKDFSPNGTFYYCNQRVESYNKVVITLKKTSLPYRRARVDHIIFGIYRTYGMSELRSASIVNQTSLISTEVPISTMRWTLDSLEDVDFLFQLKQPVEVSNNDNLIGVFYINSHSRSGPSVYSIECYDAIGV